MLRANLSSRPFYNERLVSLLLGLVAVGAIAMAAFNVSRFSELSAERTTLDLNIRRDQAEASRIRADVEAAVAGVDLNRLEALVSGAREANQLIAHRTFSWSAFFDILEGALPYEVRLLGVAHRLEGGEQVLVMSVVAEEDANLNELVQALLGTGAFFDVLPVEKARNDDGTVSAIVETFYLAPAAPERQAAGKPDSDKGGRP
jgi:hypothetical protein